MKTYRVPVSWMMCGSVYMEADSLDEAIEKVIEEDGPLPEGFYLDDSFQVDTDLAEELN
jgi:hypothetical protein